jgi:hypothetical protein
MDGWMDGLAPKHTCSIAFGPIQITAAASVLLLLPSATLVFKWNELYTVNSHSWMISFFLLIIK